MQRVILLYVGRPKTKWIEEGIRHFTERLEPHIRLETIQLQPSKQGEAEKYSREESARILESLEKMEGEVWLLDEQGGEMTSREFAKTMERAKDAGQTIIFILGGAYGVSEEVRSKAKRFFALSRMTFPHEFCQLVFLEQLYRASEIMRGTGYHH